LKRGIISDRWRRPASPLAQGRGLKRVSN